MMKEMVTHPKTATAVTQFLREPRHAVLLTGPQGVGKTAVARNIAAALLDLPPERLASYQYMTQLAPTGLSIPIEAIRDLQHFLQLKTTGERTLRRVAIIEYADHMTTEAQNAFLKMLEEPPADTMLILTANNTHALLPTILSRVQSIAVRAPLEADVRASFKEQAREQKQLDQAYFLSGGLPGLMSALLQDEQTNPLAAAVEQAKVLLQQATFERLASVDALSKKKDEAANVLQALAHIAQTGLTQAAARQDSARLQRWHRILTGVHDAQAALDVSANAKLVLTNLMLHM